MPKTDARIFIAERLRELDVINTKASERGISNAELARRVGMKPELLRRSRSGFRKLDCAEFVAICRELDLEIGDFDGVQLTMNDKVA